MVCVGGEPWQTAVLGPTVDGEWDCEKEVRMEAVFWYMLWGLGR